MRYFGRPGRLCLALLLALLVALPAMAGPPPALAHAELIRSDPFDGSVLQAPPASVRLSFSEPIEPQFFAVEVYTERLQRVDRGDARQPGNIQQLEVPLPPDLPNGTYTVVWRVLSIDGHVVRGVFTFSVGVPGRPAAFSPTGLISRGAPFGAGASVRWATFLAAFALVGSLLFVPLVLRPVLRSAAARTASTGTAVLAGPEDLAARALRGAIRPALRVAWVAAVALLVLNLVALLVQASEVADIPLSQVLGGTTVTALLTGTKYGAVWLARLAATVAVVVALTVASALPGAAARWARAAGAGAGALFLLTLSLTGHASAVPRATALAVGADWLHQLAGAIWIGGLVQLALALPAVLRAFDGAERRAVLARVVARFSLVAIACVVVLVATGTFASATHIPTLQALADTVYGASLSGKLLLFLPLLALGAVNLLVLSPRFTRGAAGQPPNAAPHRTPTLGSSAPGAFRWTVPAEIALAVAVLGVTGILTGVPPAVNAPGAGRPAREEVQADGLRVTLWVDPNRAGPNSFRVSLAGANGAVVNAERVTLQLTHTDMEMGVREVPLQRTAPGRYEGGGSFLSMAGRWNVAVAVSRPTSGVPTGQPPADVRVPFLVTVGQPPGVGEPLISPARILLLSLTPQLLLGLVVVALGLLLASQRRRLRPVQRRPLALAGSAFSLIGALAVGVTVAGAYRQSVAIAQPVRNPIEPTADSLARGGQLYAQSCLLCHGVQGRGDGPLAATLRPPPADLRVHMAAGHTDEQLFDWVSNGVPGTAMPAFKESLPEEDRWHVINYVRSFAESAPAAGASPPRP